jgi:hypothetical protein
MIAKPTIFIKKFLPEVKKDSEYIDTMDSADIDIFRFQKRLHCRSEN